MVNNDGVAEKRQNPKGPIVTLSYSSRVVFKVTETCQWKNRRTSRQVYLLLKTNKQIDTSGAGWLECEKTGSSEPVPKPTVYCAEHETLFTLEVVVD